MHANAALTPKARLRLGRMVVSNNVPVSDAAARFQCSYPTAKRWAQRFREVHEAGVVVTQEHMADRSSRPWRSPNRTPQPVVRKIVHVRWKRRLGPAASQRRAPAGRQERHDRRRARRPAGPCRPQHRDTRDR